MAQRFGSGAIARDGRTGLRVTMPRAAVQAALSVRQRPGVDTHILLHGASSTARSLSGSAQIIMTGATAEPTTDPHPATTNVLCAPEAILSSISALSEIPGAPKASQNRVPHPSDKARLSAGCHPV